MSALVLSTFHSDDVSDSIITILSMLFTMVSIFISLFEYRFFSNHFQNIDYLNFVQFNVKNSKLSSMRRSEFQDKIISVLYKFNNKLSGILEIDGVKIDRLKPIQYSEGAKFTFIIDGDHKWIVTKLTQALDVLQIPVPST